MKKDDKLFAGWSKEDEFFGKDELSRDELNGVAGGVDVISGKKDIQTAKAVEKIGIKTAGITDAAGTQKFILDDKPGIMVENAPDRD